MILRLIIIFLLCSFLSACSPYFRGTIASRYANTHAVTPPSDTSLSIKIVSFNTREGKATKKFFQRLQEYRKTAGPDVLCLQEMDSKNVQWLAGALHDNYVFYPAAVRPDSRNDLGSAILSPWAIQNDFRVPLPFGTDDKMVREDRAATAAQIRIHDRTVLVYSVHLGVLLSPERRKGQIRAVIESIPAGTKTCIVTGDFNTYAVMHTQALQPLIDVNFLRATAHVGWTYRYWYLFNRKAALDHIFVRGAKVLDAGTIPGRTGSDHRPVWVEIKI